MNETRKIFKEIKPIVLAVLKNIPEARDCDEICYYCVCNIYLKEQGLNCNNISLRDALLNRKKFNLPKLQTIDRARRLLQSRNPELQGSKVYQTYRSELEEEYREYFTKRV